MSNIGVHDFVVRVPRSITPSVIMALTRNAANLKKIGAPQADLQSALQILNDLNTQFYGTDPKTPFYTEENIDKIVLIGEL